MTCFDPIPQCPARSSTPEGSRVRVVLFLVQAQAGNGGQHCRYGIDSGAGDTVGRLPKRYWCNSHSID